MQFKIKDEKLKNKNLIKVCTGLKVFLVVPRKAVNNMVQSRAPEPDC